MSHKGELRQFERANSKGARKWHLITNHLNMIYMLAAGLVMSPAGFRGKYYKDTLGFIPGEIPLYSDDQEIPADVLELVTSERKHLVSCIATFELDGFHGPVKLIKQSGKIQGVKSQPKRKNKNDIAMLVPAPLPLSALSRISFQTAEDLQAFEKAASTVSNVGLYSHLIEENESLFNLGPQKKSWASELPLSGRDVDVPPDRGMALGGVLAMVYHIANRSNFGLEVFRTISELSPTTAVTFEDPVLSELPRWMKEFAIPDDTDERARLFWGIVESFIVCKGEDVGQNPTDIVLSYLKSQINPSKKPEYVSRLENLISDISGLSGLGGKTVSELLEQHKGSLSRAVLLSCLCEHCVDLLEFYDPAISDTEYLLAGVLMGARDGWLQLPSQMRVPELAEYVSYRMAHAEHRIREDDLQMDSPAPPVPLREYFRLDGEEWTQQQYRYAAIIADKCRWNDCISTIVTFTDSDLPESFKRNGLTLELPGSVSINEEVNKEVFLRRLGEWPSVDPIIESEVRASINSQQEEAANHADDSKSAN